MAVWIVFYCSRRFFSIINSNLYCRIIQKKKPYVGNWYHFMIVIISLIKINIVMFFLFTASHSWQFMYIAGEFSHKLPHSSPNSQFITLWCRLCVCDCEYISIYSKSISSKSWRSQMGCKTYSQRLAEMIIVFLRRDELTTSRIADKAWSGVLIMYMYTTNKHCDTVMACDTIIVGWRVGGKSRVRLMSTAFRE